MTVYSNFFGGAFFGGGFFGPGVEESGGGGGTPNRHPLPQYYSRRVLDERVTLPQDAISNPIAISVLDDAREIEKRLAKGETDYADMLEQTEHMLKQVAVYIPSTQIYNIVRTIEAKVMERRDVETAALMQHAQMKNDDDEIDELMKLGIL